MPRHPDHAMPWEMRREEFSGLATSNVAADMDYVMRVALGVTAGNRDRVSSGIPVEVINGEMPHQEEVLERVRASKRIDVLAEVPDTRRPRKVLPFDRVWLDVPGSPVAPGHVRIKASLYPVDVVFDDRGRFSRHDLATIGSLRGWLAMVDESRGDIHYQRDVLRGIFVPGTISSPLYRLSRVGAKNTDPPWTLDLVHEAAVRAALASGREVPPAVLADYPGLSEIVVRPVRDDRPIKTLTSTQRVHARAPLTVFVRLQEHGYWNVPLAMLPWDNKADKRPQGMRSLTLPDAQYAKLSLDPVEDNEWFQKWAQRLKYEHGEAISEYKTYLDTYQSGFFDLVMNGGMGRLEEIVGFLRVLHPLALSGLLGTQPPIVESYARARLRADARVLHWFGLQDWEDGSAISEPPWYTELASWVERVVAGRGRSKFEGQVARDVVDGLLSRDDFAPWFEDFAIEYAHVHGYDGVELERGIALFNPAALEPLEWLESRDVLSYRRQVMRENKIKMIPAVMSRDNNPPSPVAPDDVLIECHIKRPDLESCQRSIDEVTHAFDMLGRIPAAYDEAVTSRGQVQVALQAIDLCRLLLVRMAKLGRAVGVKAGRLCARQARDMYVPGPGAVGLARVSGFEDWTDAETELSMVWHAMAAAGRKPDSKTSLVIETLHDEHWTLMTSSMLVTTNVKGWPDPSIIDGDLMAMTRRIGYLMLSDLIRWEPGYASMRRARSILWAV